MNSSFRRAAAAIAVAAIALVSGSCEDNDVLAPTGTTIVLSANPPQAVFDGEDPTPVEVTLTALLLSEDGFPQTGIAVAFSTSAGTLASGGATLVTDSTSKVQDVLTVEADAPSSIEVTARSGSITETITVTKVVGGVAPTDGTIQVSANPATIVIDPNAGETSGSAQIAAVVFDSLGAPLADIAVRFQTTAGTLGTTSPVLTDAEGIATTLLTLRTEEPAEATVTATSGALYSIVEVTKSVVAMNEAPEASISATPQDVVQAGSQVIFDGSGSEDADGRIVRYTWTVTSDSACCGSSPPDSCVDPCADEVVVNTSALPLTRIYRDAPQNLSVTLEVEDDDGATGVRVLPYRVECYNPAPVADAGPNQSQNAAAPGEPVEIVLNGSYTTDNLPIDVDETHYRWSCGNGTVPAPLVAGDYRRVICSYTPLDGASNQWTATLTVYDNGSTGALVDGVYLCQKSSSDTAVVTLNLP